MTGLAQLGEAGLDGCFEVFKVSAFARLRQSAVYGADALDIVRSIAHP